jgi:RHS repeat-associated protein
VTSKTEGTSKWYYSYDRENRLTNATKFGGMMPRAGENIVYQYDALGRRVIRQDKKTGRTEFTHDGMDVLQDRKLYGDSTTTTNYVNGLGIDDKLKITSGSTSKYFLTDHLGSTVGLADSNGTISESASYDSFGNKLTSNLSTRYQYTGRESDETTGLMYYRARQYDPQVGRFTSEDPIGFAGGDVNLYGYVANDPQNWVDPSGLERESITLQDLPSYWDNLQGSVTYTSASFYWDGLNRKWYDQGLSRINSSDPNFRLSRVNHQNAVYSRLSPLGRAITDNGREARLLRNPLGLMWRASSAGKSSASFNSGGAIFRGIGRVGIAISVAMSVYRIATAQPCERGKVFAEEIGGFAGALAGGFVGAKIGAALGSVGGPVGAIAGAAIGGVVGGAIGYYYGSDVGGAAYVSIAGPPRCDCLPSP